MTSMDFTSRRIKVEDSFDEINDFAYDQGWTDGLPIVPPVPGKVEAMIASVGRAPEELVAEVAPRVGRATIEKIAINAVMAGCLPSYFPVLLAAVEAMTDPAFALFGAMTTNNSVAPLLIINGPIRSELDINCSYGCFGPGWRANATIGRALRFVLVNIGGAIPGRVSKSAFAHPGRYSWVIGEYEEKNPWQPLSVQRGYQVGENVVTVIAANGSQDIGSSKFVKTAEDLLMCIAHSMDWVGSNRMRRPAEHGETLLILCPDHAAFIARGGYSLDDIKRFLVENARAPMDRFPRGSQQLLIDSNRAVDGFVPVSARPEQFLIAVAGGLGGFHSIYIMTMGDSLAATRPIVR
ncbi:MAG: hypothetical protein HYX92_20840 [Chloroflexi bacterium]|nr:hypothetical protein [Chloroflexota bacterium]